MPKQFTAGYLICELKHFDPLFPPNKFPLSLLFVYVTGNEKVETSSYIINDFPCPKFGLTFLIKRNHLFLISSLPIHILSSGSQRCNECDFSHQGQKLFLN